MATPALRAVLPSMKERRFGRLIHISGVDGFAAHLTDRVHNITCKAGVQTCAAAPQSVAPAPTL